MNKIIQCQQNHQQSCCCFSNIPDQHVDSFTESINIMEPILFIWKSIDNSRMAVVVEYLIIVAMVIGYMAVGLAMKGLSSQSMKCTRTPAHTHGKNIHLHFYKCIDERQCQHFHPFRVDIHGGGNSNDQPHHYKRRKAHGKHLVVQKYHRWAHGLFNLIHEQNTTNTTHLKSKAFCATIVSIIW